MTRCEEHSVEQAAAAEGPNVSKQRWACTFCHFGTHSSTALRQHARSAHNKCLRCRIMFNSAEEFREHLLRANCSQRVCFLCKADFSSKRALVEHGASCSKRAPGDAHSNDADCEPEHACDLCSSAFAHEDKLENHLQNEHFYCFPCSREFSHRKSLVDHLKSSPRHHYCALCSTDFLDSQELHRHRFSGLHDDPAVLRIPRPSAAVRWHDDAARLRKYIESERLIQKLGALTGDGKTNRDERMENAEFDAALYEDDEYAKLVDRLSRLTRFLDKLEECNPEYAGIVRRQQKSENEFRLPPAPSWPRVEDFNQLKKRPDPLSCALCREEFENKTDWEWHEYDNHQWCSVCNKQFASRNALVEHILGTKGHHFCFDCCKVFFLGEMLAEHRRSVWHASPANKPVRMSDQLVVKKVFVCDECEEGRGVFPSEEGLRRHLERNHFSCLECDREFKSRKALVRHYERSKRHNFCRDCEMNLPSRLELNEHLILGKHRD